MILAILPGVTLRRWSILLLLTLVLIQFALTSCNPAQFKTEAAQPELVTTVLEDPKTFNIAISQEAGNVGNLIYEGLVTEDGLTGKVEPDQAKSWKISEDNKQIVFTLREGLKWSDGHPLTADDVVFTYNDIYFNELIPNNYIDGFRIGQSRALPKVRKLDERQVEFTLPEPFAPFLRATESPIFPAHALRDAVNTKDSQGRPKFLSIWGTDTDPTQVIGNGPYVMKSYATSQRVVFRRNPYYWRKDAQGNPQPYIERVVWQIVQSTDTSVLQFRSGSLDSLGVDPDYFSLLKREEERGKFTIYNGGPLGGSWTFISFNLNKGRKPDGTPLVDPIRSRWFNTVAFRQAIAYSINRQTMLNNTFHGLGELQNSSITRPSPYVLTPAEGLKVYDYNLEQAKKLLLGAGFKYDDKGQLLDADDNRVRFTLITNAGNKIREAMGAQIKRDLSKIGIQVDFSPIAFNTLTDKLSNTLQWECYLLSLVGSAVEPNDAANVWSPEGALHSFNQMPQRGQSKLTGREVPDWEAEINRLYIQGAKELHDVKRKAIYAKAQNLEQEYLPYINLINPFAMSAVRDHFKGIKFSSFEGAFWNIYEIKVVEK